ncbi:hypothetical protein Tco_1020400 [Tanacetum coccineum]
MSGSPEPRHDHSESPQKRDSERKMVFQRLEKGVFHRLEDKGKSTSTYSNDSRRRSYHSSRRDTESCYQSSRSRETEFASENSGSSFRKVVTFNQRIKAKKWKIPGEGGKKWGNLMKGKTAGNTDGTIMTEGEEDGTEGPMIVEAEIGGNCVHRMHVDRGSTSKILYEHCFNRFRPEVRRQMVPATTPLVEFSGDIIWPLGQISLLVKIGDEEHSTSAWMNFMVVRSPYSYNGIIGRPGVRRIQAIPSTTHIMLKFPVTGGTVTLQSSRIILLECTMVSGPGVPQPVINQVTKEKIQVAIHLEYPKQTIAIGSTLTEEGRKELCRLLRRNLDIFAWKLVDMTGVPHHIAEHRFQRLEQSMPQRWLSVIGNILEGRVPL